MDSQLQILAILELLITAEQMIEALRALNHQSLDGRSLSIALTELQTAQLWLANARKDA